MGFSARNILNIEYTSGYDLIDESNKEYVADELSNTILKEMKI